MPSRLGGVPKEEEEAHGAHGGQAIWGRRARNLQGLGLPGLRRTPHGIYWHARSCFAGWPISLEPVRSAEAPSSSHENTKAFQNICCLPNKPGGIMLLCAWCCAPCWFLPSLAARVKDEGKVFPARGGFCKAKTYGGRFAGLQMLL
jgi:hypothetical protein